MRGMAFPPDSGLSREMILLLKTPGLFMHPKSMPSLIPAIIRYLFGWFL